MLVQKKGTRDVYAMKVLKKDHIRKNKQVDHTKTERAVLGQVKCPFIVRMEWAFQVGGFRKERGGGLFFLGEWYHVVAVGAVGVF